MMTISHRQSAIFSLTLLFSFLSFSSAQTFSTCNPLTQGSCPADPALGKSIDIDFTNGAPSDFTSSGAPTFGSNGAQFTVAQHGDSPTITSKWYIMFGHVEYVIKAAPGTGIVSSAVLQSDCLDEIDWEWLGGDDTQAQSNYFGKGITTTYNRGAFHGAPNNHDQFHTYTIDWTKDQIVWQIDGTTVRVLTQDQAASGQYPQTPMQIKVGAWAGGDPSNPQGTIEWAGGITDYSAGPFTMYLKSISVTDYSSGSQYTYSGTAGTWQSIQAAGGQVNSKGSDTPTATAAAPAVTSTVSNSAPLAFNPSEVNSATRTGWPWIGSATVSAVTTMTTSYTSIAGLPSGWSINSSGKVVPPNSGSTLFQYFSSSAASSQDSPSASGPDSTSSQPQQTTSSPTDTVSSTTLSQASTSTITSSAQVSQSNASSKTTISLTRTQSVSSNSPVTTRITSSVASLPTTATTTPPAVAANDAYRPKLGSLLTVMVMLILIFIRF